MEPTTDSLDDILIKLVAAIPEVKAASIVSAEGLPIASALPLGVDETRIAPMTSALFSLAEKSIIEMEKGKIEQLYIKSSDGYLFILQAGPNAVLTISTTKDVRLGLIFGSDNDRDLPFPFPYIGKPPSPPGDLSLAGQGRPKEHITEQILEYEPYCKHCGAELPEGQLICHVCGKKVR